LQHIDSKYFSIEADLDGMHLYESPTTFAYSCVKN